MLEKIRNKIAWICVTLIISGILLVILDVTGNILLLLLGVLIFIFLFVPIEFFILPYKKESPSQRIFSYLRGICFFVICFRCCFFSFKLAWSFYNFKIKYNYIPSFSFYTLEKRKNCN